LADADGVIMETLGEPGQVVAAGQIVVRLAHTGPREATVNLPEAIRPAIGSEASATVYGDQTSRFPARLRQLSDAADPVSRTYEARYVLEGAAADAPLGATVTIRIPDSNLAKIVKVPLGAIADRGATSGVWLIDQSTSTVTFRPVKLAGLGAEAALIEQGLAVGDQVVALGAHLLHEGESVRAAGKEMASR
jgi:RND family efflux transporter MFP subunit